MNQKADIKQIIPSKRQPVKTGIAGIKVTVHVPEQLHERVRQQKVNRIYDILSSEKSL